VSQVGTNKELYYDARPNKSQGKRWVSFQSLSVFSVLLRTFRSYSNRNRLTKSEGGVYCYLEDCVAVTPYW